MLLRMYELGMPACGRRVEERHIIACSVRNKIKRAHCRLCIDAVVVIPPRSPQLFIFLSIFPPSYASNKSVHLTLDLDDD